MLLQFDVSDVPLSCQYQLRCKCIWTLLEWQQKGSEEVSKFETARDAEEAAFPNMRLSPDTAVLSTVFSPKSVPCAGTAMSPEQARHAWSPLTIQDIHSTLCYCCMFAWCYRGKREERKFSFNIYTKNLSMDILLLQYWSFFPPFLREFVLFL